MQQIQLKRLLRWGTPLFVFIGVLLSLTAINGSSDAESSPPPPPSDSAPAGGGTEGLVASLEAASATNPNDAEAAAALGHAYYQLSRETGDPTLYSRADEAFARALVSDPDQVSAITGQATLALVRHEFAGGLKLAKRAHSIEPDLLAPYPALFDAQIELGRYDEAARTLDQMVSLRPSLAAYARVSYFRELNGDLPGALEAMRLAVSAGSGSGEGEAYVRNLLAKLQADLGRYSDAEQSYRSALATNSSDAAAIAGLASIEAGRDEFGRAIIRLRSIAEVQREPVYALALAETEEAAGRAAAAERDYALAARKFDGLEAAGENTAVERALFEADHGSVAEAIRLGRAAWNAAPSVRAADAYAWALHTGDRAAAARRFSARAMRLGSRDPNFLYRAGVIAAESGSDARAERLLGRLVEQSPKFNPLYGPRAMRELARLR